MSRGWEWDVRGGTILRLRRHPAPNKPLHRIAARLRFEVNLKGLCLGGKR